MHADHVLGLVRVLAHLMSGVGTSEEQREAIRKQGVNKKVSPAYSGVTVSSPLTT